MSELLYGHPFGVSALLSPGSLISCIKFWLIERPRVVHVSLLEELDANVNISISFNCIITLSGEFYYYPHCIDEETEAEGG